MSTVRWVQIYDENERIVRGMIPGWEGNHEYFKLQQWDEASCQWLDVAIDWDV